MPNFPAVEFRDSVVGRPQDFPAIGEALIRIWDQMGDIDWSDRVAFATRAQTQH